MSKKENKKKGQEQSSKQYTVKDLANKFNTDKSKNKKGSK